MDLQPTCNNIGVMPLTNNSAQVIFEFIRVLFLL